MVLSICNYNDLARNRNVLSFVIVALGVMQDKRLNCSFLPLLKVPPVTWSMDLQKEAEAWVKYLAENNKFQHSRHNPGNLYLQGQIPKEYCSDAIWWFHWEEKYYNYSDPRYSRSTGHFTQVGNWREEKR